MRWCTVQTNECDLQAKTFRNICTHHKLRSNNENKFPETRLVDCRSVSLCGLVDLKYFRVFCLAQNSISTFRLIFAKKIPPDRYRNPIINLRRSEVIGNIMGSDALAPCVARTSAPMILTVWNRKVLVLHEEGFKLPVSCQGGGGWGGWGWGRGWGGGVGGGGVGWVVGVGWGGVGGWWWGGGVGGWGGGGGGVGWGGGGWGGGGGVDDMNCRKKCMFPMKNFARKGLMFDFTHECARILGNLGE